MKTKVLKVNPDLPEKNLINNAATLLRKGGLVAFPTETVYGIGAHYLDKKAIERLYKIKKRPKNKPFTVHIAGFEALKGLKICLSGHAERVINRFWPGPLTVVTFNKKKEKIGIRMPRNKIALELINTASFPIVAPSANMSGKKAPTSAKEVMDSFSGSIDMILDGGKTDIGIESTVIDVTKEPFKILRQGALSKEDLLADYNILFVCTGNSCRSVMAKGILEKLVKEAGLSEKINIDSAGTGGFRGMKAAQNTIEVMKEEGIDVTMHSGKGITEELLKKSDIVFVMEEMHRDIILSRFSALSGKARLLKEGVGVVDPIGKSLEEYRRNKNIIKDFVENIFLELYNKYK